MARRRRGASDDDRPEPRQGFLVRARHSQLASMTWERRPAVRSRSRLRAAAKAQRDPDATLN